LRKAVLEKSSPLWSISEVEGEQVLQVTGNIATTYETGTAAYLVEDRLGKVALIGEAKHNYRMQAEMRFLGHHHPMARAGWFGFAIRAQDFLNYEIVWFIPNAEAGNTVAYVPVAHGIVPWWTEAYAGQKKGNAHIPTNAWFHARLDVIDDEFTVYVEDRLVFTKKITYYLTKGRPGFYVGTATDAAFRRVIIEDVK
jgi:hypothetical protein